MSSLKRRPDGQWRARYRDEADREHARHFARKIDGQRWLDEVTAAVVTGQYVDPKAGRVLLRDYAAAWEAGRVCRPSTARIVDNALRVHLLPALGERPLATIRRSDVQGLIKALSERLAPGTVRNVYDTAAKLFGAAVDDRLIAETPCRRIVLPTVEGGEVVAPTVEEVQALAGAVPARYRAAVVLLAGSGLRIGELLGLRVADVDFLRRELRVERQRLQDGTLAAPKTPQSVRTVPLGRVVVDELAAHLAAHGGRTAGSVRAQGRRTRSRSGGGGGEWLLTTGTGAPLGYRTWRAVWDRAQRPAPAAVLAEVCPTCPSGAGEPCRNRSGTVAARPHGARADLAREGVEAVDTHALRHFYAAALIAGGASVKQVSRLLGHSSAVVTLKVYAHLWPGDDDRARSVVDAALDVLRTGRGLTDHG